MDRSGLSPSRDELYQLLESYSKAEDLQVAQRIYALMSKNNLFSVTILSDQIIRLFASCASLQDAVDVFQKVPYPTVYTYNAIMSAHSKLGNGHDVFRLYHQMNLKGIHGDTVTCVNIVKACTTIRDLQTGRHIHRHLLIGRHDHSIFIGNSLVDMYAKCGSLEDAQSIFNALPYQTEASWGALLTGYSSNGQSWSTLELFESMRKGGIKPSRVAYLCALKASSDLNALKEGRLVHAYIIFDRIELDSLVRSALVDMYAKCGSLEDAYMIFKALPTQDVVVWSALIVGYAQHGYGKHALELFEQMLKSGVIPGKVAFSAAIKGCASMGALLQGYILHDSIIRRAYETDTVIGSSIIDMYIKAERLVEARKIFDKLVKRDSVAWGTMMTGYAQHGRGHAALDLFMRMQQENVRPGKTAFLSVLKECGSLGTTVQGRLLHREVLKHEFDSDLSITNTLIDMYAKCGSLDEAQCVFDRMKNKDIVSWGAIMSGFVTHGYGTHALSLFFKLQAEKLPLNEVIFYGALRACGIMQNIEYGMLVHAYVIHTHFPLDIIVEGSIIDMYVKCGRFEDAHSMLNYNSNSYDVVSWGTLMTGFADAGDGLAVMELFKSMMKNGLTPDKVTLICGIKACGMLGALEWGKWAHSAVVEAGLETDVIIGTNLIDMYSKCHSMDNGHQVFKSISDHDMASWGSLIGGHALVGNFLQVDVCLMDMRKQNLMPTDLIFTSILAACSQAGLVEEGCIYFQMMIKDFGIQPSDEHHSCMVDLFARVGKLDDASDLTTVLSLCDMPVQRSMLSSCRTYKRVNLAMGYFDEA
ncbi:hypothetical protein KP509_09G085300 [Ceratopteris richardii]|nr:hypothetical protein KP509_09G085300 [Ceratopteris richardii]